MIFFENANIYALFFYRVDIKLQIFIIKLVKIYFLYDINGRFIFSKLEIYIADSCCLCHICIIKMSFGMIYG